MERDYLKSLTSILKKKLMHMMIHKWQSEYDFKIEELSDMADDVINVIDMPMITWEVLNEIDDEKSNK